MKLVEDDVEPEVMFAVAVDDDPEGRLEASVKRLFVFARQCQDVTMAETGKNAESTML